jgi:hypothetical protein
MKKTIGILTLSLILFSFNTKSLNGFITLFENSSSAKYYKYGKNFYFEYFDNNKDVINKKEYYIRYRKYSWGKIDTAYYRKDNDNYYHLDRKTLEESIVLPIKPELGDKWFENDKSWSYEIIAVGKKFKTKTKKYKNCIKVLCKQLTSRDKLKNKEYYLYYSPKFGYIGNTNEKGKILSYLNEIKLNSKEGDKIGVK